MVAAVCVFSIMDALLKRLSTHYAPMQVACLRCFSSLVFVAGTVIWNRSWSALRMTNPWLHLARGVLGTTMLGCFVFAVHRLTMAQTYSLFLCAPLLMTALSVPILGERVPGRRWLAIAIGLSGVLVILQPWGTGISSMIAAAAAALATVCYALSALTVRFLSRRNSTIAMVFWMLALVGTASLILATDEWRPIMSDDWAWIAAVGLSGSLGQTWLTDAFKHAPASVVGPFEYTAIVWAFAIDWVFWSAAPNLSLLIGAGIVIATGVFIVLDERRLADLTLIPASPPP